jgi:hypothetical protein
MARTWTTVEVTGLSSAPRTGYLLLPKGTANPPSAVLVRGKPGGKIRVLRGGVRADTGTAGWADAEIVADADVVGGHTYLAYSPVGVFGAIGHSGAAALQAAIAVLTIVATVFGLIAAFMGTNGGHVFLWIAIVALVVGGVLAVVTFIRDWTSIGP